MTLLLDRAFPRTLDALVERLLAERPSGKIEAWLFENAAPRRAAEARLAASGITAKLHSAYKPLLCFFLEETDPADLRRVAIRYPVHELAPAGRFLAEAYPLAALLGEAELSVEPGRENLVYEVELTDKDGVRHEHRVAAPNRAASGVLRNCGWLAVAGGTGEPMQTETEALFDAALATIRAQGWSGEGPYFERLALDAALPFEDVPLGWGEEALSLAEALHEDLFFSLREALSASNSGSARDRRTRPGQIVPNVRGRAGDAHLRIELASFGVPADTAVNPVAVASADRPLGMAQIEAELSSLGHESFEARSREGRPVRGMYKPGSATPVLITAAQHANETTGVVGALRAARLLAADPAAHFAFVPVENVDGYALHQRLIEANPHHMHHAARYTAFGDDVSTHRGTDTARAEALRRSGARLHINLHGYPAHEWTRPLSGYLPGGFEDWTMPRGFFLIMVHHPGWREQGDLLLGHVAEAVGSMPALAELNRRQLACRHAHATDRVPDIRHDIPCTLSEAMTYETPLTLITEAPDETVYGPAFVLQQEAQTRAVLAAMAFYAGLQPNRALA